MHRCQPRYSLATNVLFAMFLFASAPLLHAQPPVLSGLFAEKVEANAESDYMLSEEDGPWLILAATFGGDEGREQAQDLILELRRAYNLPAYLHRQTFDYSQPLDVPTARETRMRYANSSRYDAWTVLVGHFDSASHPRVEKVLDVIKHAHPEALDHTKNGGRTAQRFAMLREFYQNLTESEKERARGPMGKAFVTRNPLLPDEYFETPPIDSFVRSLNEEVDYSLLDAAGKFTVVVKTFEGDNEVQFGTLTGKDGEERNASQLDHAAVSADKLCRELRRRGVEAYQFHDRYRSLVTVGTFRELGNATNGGGFRYSPDITATIERFSGQGEVMQTSYGTVMRSKATAGIVFDLQPRAIAIPKPEKRSVYLGGLLEKFDLR